MKADESAWPPRYEPSTVEERVYRLWIEAGCFAAAAGSSRAPYVIVIPPPNITGILTMGHVLNNTLQEDWEAKPDSGQQWSHCAVAPLYIAYMGLAGIRPLEPGFRRVEVRPQPADLSQLEMTARTVRGPLVFRSLGNRGNRELTLELPNGCEGEIILPEQETVDLAPLKEKAPFGLKRWGIQAGAVVTLKLRNI